MNAQLKRRRTVALRGLLVAILIASTAALATPGKILRTSELRERPFLEAARTGELAARTEVDILAREGGWIQVRSANGQTGWVRLLNVQAVAESRGAAGFLSGLQNLGNVAATGSTGATATTGAKGISREDLANAQPDEKQLLALEKLNSSEANGRKHAAANKLRAQVSEPLDPKPRDAVGESNATPTY